MFFETNPFFYKIRELKYRFKSLHRYPFNLDKRFFYYTYELTTPSILIENTLFYLYIVKYLENDIKIDGA